MACVFQLFSIESMYRCISTFYGVIFVRKAFLYSDQYFRYNYGPHHPARIERLKLTYDLINSYGLLDLPDVSVVEVKPANLKEIESFHRIEYLSLLSRCSRGEYDLEEAMSFGLGPGDNPVFEGMWEWSLLTAGGSLQAGRIVAEGDADVAFNIAGGMHHARDKKASGFCYVNDIALLIKDLVARGLRVAYVDVDAHHGDGVQEAFYDTDQVLTISIHQHGHHLFPGTGYVYETGKGRGQGFAVNIPMYPGSDDELFLRVFNSLVPDLINGYKPDILVTQLGVDTLKNDPLTSMCLTTNGFVDIVTYFKSLKLPWVALGGGGYHIVNVARAWTLCWAVMNETDPPDDLPSSFIEKISPYGYRERKLRDAPFLMDGSRKKEAESVARQVIDSVREMLAPAIIRSGNLAANRNRSSN